MICESPTCSALADVVMHIKGDGAVSACFACADRLMRDLAPMNVAGGSSIGETAAGYARWRAAVGRPCTAEQAIAMVVERMGEQ